MVCRHNVNVLGVVVILLLERLLEESLWLSLENSLWLKCIIYPLLLAICLRLRYDGMFTLAMSCLLASIAAECYWYASDYANTPGIYWYNIIICQNLLVRYLIFSRVAYTEQWFKRKAESTHLDWFVYQITRYYILFNWVMVLEYLVRHLFDVPSLVIYHSYSAALQIVATFTLFIVFQETSKLLQQHMLKA